MHIEQTYTYKDKHKNFEKSNLNCKLNKEIVNLETLKEELMSQINFSKKSLMTTG